MRTVPPAGVTLIDTSYFKFIDTARNHDINNIDCQTPYGANSSLITVITTNKATAFTAVSSVLAANAAHAMEFWMYTPTAGGTSQMIQETPDTAYLFQVAMYAGRLNVDVYTTGTHSATSASFTLSNQFAATIPSTLSNWSHIVVQGSNFRSGTMQVYLNGVRLTALSGAQPSAVGWTVISTATNVNFPSNISTLKHLRIYNRLMSQGEITANAGDLCLMPSSTSQLAAWYRFNVPAAGSATTVADNSTVETSLSKIFPDHVLRTNYTYNATNQVIKQSSPDGGTNQYWYDILSRLSVSQNDKQKALNNFSYTLYDNIGRITEVGQKTQTPMVTLPAPGYLPAATITSFNSAGANSQITDTYYDGNVPTVSGVQTALTVHNQRKRVSATTYTETAGAPVRQATYYDYDLDGNVKTLWQQVDSLGTKRVDYEYDLVSGKVNFVRYQDQQPDRFYYKYNYDAENRITEAWSGTEAIVNPYTGSDLLNYNGRMDARYYYYLHGPLARMELGDVNGKVQGTDYAYTLQGWLKGVNSTTVTSTQDMGGDGQNTSTIPLDAYGYSLYYHGDGTTRFDYKAQAVTTQPFETSPVQKPEFKALYNGNIAGSSMNLPQLGAGWHYNYYQYDQLNRLTKNQLYTATNNNSVISNNYKETFAYDGNGNIKQLYRTADTVAGNNLMDNLTYHYSTDGLGRITSNRLNYITDIASDANWTNDLKNQTSTGNYTYDAIGNLTADVQAGISAIGWNVYGKIQSITKATGSIAYDYNSAQQRTKKRTGGINTWYVRDAQGNTLAIYDNKNGTTNWREQQLYGSSRLGTWLPNIKVGTDSSYAAWDTFGHKQYELSNHLGNVMATITDRRVQQADGSGNNLAYFKPDVATAQQYYAFGSLMPDRTYAASSNYRYGFNGKENDNEVKGTGNQIDFGSRIYDPRVGMFLSVDPDMKKYPAQSSYLDAADNPIRYIDEDGRGPIIPPGWWQRQGYAAGFASGFADGAWEIVEMSFEYTPTYMITHPQVIKERYNQVVSLGKLAFVISTDESVCSQMTKMVENELGAYVDDVSFKNGNSKAGYAQGKLAFTIATMFIGAGEAKAAQTAEVEAMQVATKAEKFIELMKQAAAFEKNIIKLADQSGKYIGKVIDQVSFKLADGTMGRFDGVGKLADGTFQIIEAKMGGGTLSKAQRKVLEALRNGEKVFTTSGKSEGIFGKAGVDVSEKLSKDVLLNTTEKTVSQVLKGN